MTNIIANRIFCSTFVTVSPLAVASTQGRAQCFPNAGLFYGFLNNFMAKKIKLSRRTKGDSVFPFDAANYFILGFGLVTILVGYILLARSDVRGFTPLVLSPILLVLGYCILIPFGIMYRKKQSSASIQNEIESN